MHPPAGEVLHRRDAKQQSEAFRERGSRHAGLARKSAHTPAVPRPSVEFGRIVLAATTLRPCPIADVACRLPPRSRGIRRGGDPHSVGSSGAASLAFVGPVATAFAYWAVVETGRHFGPAVLSMALLAAPTPGILISAIALGERVGASLIAGVVLIAPGIRLVTAEPRR
jgi:hypothetical protein